MEVPVSHAADGDPPQQGSFISRVRVLACLSLAGLGAFMGLVSFSDSHVQSLQASFRSDGTTGMVDNAVGDPLTWSRGRGGVFGEEASLKDPATVPLGWPQRDAWGEAIHELEAKIRELREMRAMVMKEYHRIFWTAQDAKTAESNAMTNAWGKAHSALWNEAIPSIAKVGAKYKWGIKIMMNNVQDAVDDALVQIDKEADIGQKIEVEKKEAKKVVDEFKKWEGKQGEETVKAVKALGEATLPPAALTDPPTEGWGKDLPKTDAPSKPA